jgi:hypothetical protein
MGVWSDCPESILEHGPLDRYGRCPWCGQKIAPAVRRPAMDHHAELTDAYGYYYEPDFGSDNKDVY